MKGADKALYEAKRTGKNDYRIATRIDPPTVTQTFRNLSS